MHIVQGAVLVVNEHCGSVLRHGGAVKFRNFDLLVDAPQHAAPSTTVVKEADCRHLTGFRQNCEVIEGLERRQCAGTGICKVLASKVADQRTGPQPPLDDRSDAAPQIHKTGDSRLRQHC